MRRRFALTALVTFFGLGALGLPASRAAEIDFVEDFALSVDRPAALKQLIPGTEDYYYYHAIHALNTEQYEQVRNLLKPWIERHKRTPRVVEIETRLALLDYQQNPQATLDYLRNYLGIQFNHQKEVLGVVPNMPMELDSKLIARSAFLSRTFGQVPNTAGVEDAGLEWLIDEKLTPERLRHLLQRLTRPDHANLVSLIVEDLNRPNSPGFGAFPIHRQLLLAQLDQLLKLKPDLLDQANFVQTYLAKLQPGPDDDWRHDVAVREAYFDRLSSFVSRLAPVHNSLKAHVLYHRLVSDRAQGKFDKDRFLAYLKLPRHLPYVARKYLESDEHRRFPADLNADFNAGTLLPPIGTDEPLVRSYLAKFFVDAANFQEFASYIDDTYLKHAFAEIKIVNGLGEPEQWASQLPPELFRQLRERVDIDFVETNSTNLAANSPVQLQVYVKNVPTMIVKVFEINASNFFRQNLREVDTDINLDGLVANEEKTYTYNDSPLRRVTRTLDFPQLKGAGVYVIDFIGNGRSSRALLRKGKLRQLARTTSAGQQLTVLNEHNQPQKDVVAWLDGREYTASKDGTILVPFTANSGRRAFVLSRGDFASLDYLQHEGEGYVLEAGIHVDREALLARKKAQVIVRPSLKLNGIPVSLELLEEGGLSILAIDHDGVPILQEIPNVKVSEDREGTHEFQVPGRLASLEFVLHAKVKKASDGKPVDVSARHRVSINGIDQTDKIEDLHLARFGDEYVIELRGRTGEAKPDRGVQLVLKHRDFVQPLQLTLKTNPQGRVKLGALTDIVSVTATGPENVGRTWPIRQDSHSYAATYHGRVGETLVVPYLGQATEPKRDELSLLELRGDSYVADRFASLKIVNAFVQVSGLPAGDYELRLKSLGQVMRMRIVEGPAHDGYVLGGQRQLETRPLPPLQIERITADAETVSIQLANDSKFARVHVVADRYLPAFSLFDDLGRVRAAELYAFVPGRVDSVYVTGRNIGDEYRYILDRKYAQKFPGNTLERPSLLLNPWAVRSTQTDVQIAQGGDAFGRATKAFGGNAARESGQQAGEAGLADYANLDFLFMTSTVLANLEPSKDGVVTVPRKALGSRQHVHVIAVDPIQTTHRSYALPEQEQPILDLRLADGLDPKAHFTQQKLISVVPAGQAFVLNDVSASRFETYDSLARLYALFATLLNNPQQLADFRFITEWSTLKPEQKRTNYSKYASHELNFFLARKDPEFFQQVVKPYLQNKKDKTYLDRWLTGTPLDEYTQSWKHGQLNVFERVLLGQRLDAERPRAARHVSDLYELLPPNVDRFIRLFDTAVKGSALDQAGVESLAKLQVAEHNADRSLLYDEQSLGVTSGKPSDSAATPALPPAPGSETEDSKKRKAGKSMSRLEESTEKLKRDAGGKNARDGRMDADEETGDRAKAFFERSRGSELAQQLFRQLDPTMEWAENNYHHLTIDLQNSSLITTNAFWRDLANHDAAAPFRSRNVAEASNNMAEILMALGLIDLPFKAEKHDMKIDGLKLTLTPGSPLIVYHEEIRQAQAAAPGMPILVSQNFFRHGDRHRMEGGEQVDKYVVDEFLVHAVYGCQVVVTNPTSTRQKLNVLTQIPVGAVPVLKSQATKTVYLTLEPYHTQTVEYYFYFPRSGDFAHFPVHVAKNEQLAASAGPQVFHVVEMPTKIDAQSWGYVSQHGTNDEVLEFLKKQNVHGLALDKIAFRMRDAAYFEAVTKLLADRHAYNEVLWSYSLMHNSVPTAREYLQHVQQLIDVCGGRLASSLLKIDPVARRSYEHLEYKPLVNARAHSLGKRRQIVNDRFYQLYHRFMKQLSYQRELTDDDWLTATYYLLLQDRVADALASFERVKPENIAARMQYDYCAAYLDLFQEDFVNARQIAAKYAEHPVDRWRNTFAAITAQLDEAAGADTKPVDADDRNQQQTTLAATAPSFDLQLEARKLTINYQNLKSVRVNYYLMDVELLFSRNPFVQEFGDEFSAIRPNLTQEIALPKKQSKLQSPLPESLANRNIIVEVVAAGQAKRQPYYSNGLTVQVIGNYGQVRVTKAADGKPVSKAYVKVYARSADGGVKFYKDGYTDVRGRFDYASLSTDDLTTAQRFAVLILSDEHGAVVREADPPAR